MTEHMSDERLALLEQFSDDAKGIIGDELIAALKAERQRVEELERWFHGYRTPELSMAEMFKQLKAAETRLAAIGGLPNKWRKGIVTYERDGSRSEGPMCGNDCAAELEVELNRE